MLFQEERDFLQSHKRTSINVDSVFTPLSIFSFNHPTSVSYINMAVIGRETNILKFSYSIQTLQPLINAHLPLFTKAKASDKCLGD